MYVSLRKPLGHGLSVMDCALVFFSSLLQGKEYACPQHDASLQLSECML